jgi:hypothetical protein
MVNNPSPAAMELKEIPAVAAFSGPAGTGRLCDPANQSGRLPPSPSSMAGETDRRLSRTDPDPAET